MIRKIETILLTLILLSTLFLVGCINQEETTESLYAKGTTLLKQGKYNEAIECYDKAIEIDPYHKEAWNGKGGALLALGKYNEAIECFDKVITIDPNLAYAWRNKGTAFLGLGKYSEAQEYFDKAKEIDNK